MVNGRGIGLLDNLDTVLQHGDHFLILPPVGGGQGLLENSPAPDC
ncbi:MAG: MoaD/ThiS family protein [Deltaproteobacteria bacterium]|nr:MoaD/ThiS family protein [Deltaproteobacteria bacterium]